MLQSNSTLFICAISITCIKNSRSDWPYLCLCGYIIWGNGNETKRELIMKSPRPSECHVYSSVVEIILYAGQNVNITYRNLAVSMTKRWMAV